MGKVKTEDLRDKYFFNIGVKKIRRLRQIWVRKYGFWFFKDTDPELARNWVKKIDAEVHTQKDINEYLAKLSTKDYDKSKPLWEVHVIEDYDENTSVVFVSMHHLLSDGMGIISMITFLNDSHNPNNITQFREIPFFYYYILPILYTPYGLLRYIYEGLNTKGDPNMYPFLLKTGKQSMKKEYYETKYYELADIKKWYGNFDKMKLNDFMFAIISAALSKYFIELGIPEDKQTHFSLSIPINMKPQPKTIDEVQFCNSWSLCLANIPLSTNLEYTMKKNRETFDPGFTLTALRFGVWVVSFMGILPEVFSRLTIRDNSKRLNTIISNTPGPQSPIYFCDQMVYDMCGVGPNVGWSGLTMLISSYAGKVKLQLLADSNLNMDPKELLKHLESQLDQSIQKIC